MAKKKKIVYTKLRETFQSPYREHRIRVGEKFTLLGPNKGKTDSEVKGELFDIQFEDGTKIVAWAEEIYSDAGWNP